MFAAVTGLADFARGSRFLFSHPRLWVWVAAPAVATLLFVVALVWGVLVLAEPAVAWVSAEVPSGWAAFAGGFVRVLVVGGLGLLAFLTFVSITGAIAGPFCELLSEAVETRVTGSSPRGFSLAAFLRGLLSGVLHALRRLFVYLFGLILVLVLAAVIPVVGPVIAVVLTAYFAATSAAYDCFDSIFSRRLWPYRQKLQFLRTHRARSLGLGAAVAGLMLVPVLNLLALGVGAAAATLATLDLERPRP